MTRKDYVKIAAVLKRHCDVRHVDAAARSAMDIALDMASMLAADNPNFDRAKFLKACGMEEQP